MPGSLPFQIHVLEDEEKSEKVHWGQGDLFVLICEKELMKMRGVGAWLSSLCCFTSKHKSVNASSGT